ncbi:MAG TPA: sigma-54 dependent transcriptional regulator [Vicinamibacteria bacterium]|nr:sigma-54 dependent transcriptional regulator [Vicinamibacteria bacterium]
MPGNVAALAGLIGRCPAMERLKRDLVLFGPSDERVHVFGETGTGKEVVAKAVHALSARAGRAMVAVNVAGLSDELLISELFGHARGAFTGAVSDHEGYVARAEGSTLFVDEVGDMSPLAQVRLLRFLEDGEYQRLGDTAVRRANVRVVSATSVDLERRVREGRFRRDLWFRLKGERLDLPPLRERGDDVLLLARHFLHRQAAERGGAPPALGREAEAALLGHSWPGNVRELQYEMRCAGVRATGRPVAVEDLSPELRERPTGRAGPLREAVRRFEAELIQDALERHHGNVARAATELGITRQALWARTRRPALVAQGA